MTKEEEILLIEEAYKRFDFLVKETQYKEETDRFGNEISIIKKINNC